MKRIIKSYFTLSLFLCAGLSIFSTFTTFGWDKTQTLEQNSRSAKIASGKNTIKTANPYASEATRNLLKHLYYLSAKKKKKVISCQYAGTNGGSEFDTTGIQNLVVQTGHFPAMIGMDYCDSRNSDTQVPLFKSPNPKRANPDLIRYWKEGGLVTINIHLWNPQSGFNFNSYDADIPELLNEKGEGHDIYMSWLDTIAQGLQELQDSGVVVLWRPFHERFWWGRNPLHYRELWKHMFNYFTYEKKLNNLLWVYSPEGARIRQPIEKYPGDEYVDIVALDLYRLGHIYPLEDNDPAHAVYNFLVTKGKPFMIGEIGIRENLKGTWDTIEIIKAIKEYFPKAIAFQAWGYAWSLGNNLNAKQLLNDSWILNREDIPN